jgi:hypothetical protein
MPMAVMTFAVWVFTEIWRLREYRCLLHDVFKKMIMKYVQLKMETRLATVGCERRRLLAEPSGAGLELHPEKTRLIQFGRFAAQNRKERGEGKPETFTFLGFTHYCGKRRKDGAFTVWRATAKKRMAAKLLAIKAELIRRRHESKAVAGEWLQKVVLGYYRYHAVPGNLRLAHPRLRR